MTLNARLIFGDVRHETASTLRALYANCQKASIIAGFMTVEGVNSISEALEANPRKLDCLVVGAATYRAFDAFDQLIVLGAKSENLRVHLGHSRKSGARARHPFYKYHPMLHSKIYLFEKDDNQASLLVGSHNMTGFALSGLNGEAAILVEGDAYEQIFADARSHIKASYDEAVQYKPALREAFAWWAEQFMEGLAMKFDDAPRTSTFARTIVILAEDQGHTPQLGDKIYFELPKALGRINLISAEVHLYLFDALPTPPSSALSFLSSAKRTIWCRTIGLEDDRGGRELQATWFIDDHMHPAVKMAPSPFRPTPAQDTEQVRVEVFQSVRGTFEYLFSNDKKSFEPIFDREDILELPEDDKQRFEDLGLIPAEHYPWHKVIGFAVQEEASQASAYKEAMKNFSPAGGSYILLSMRRRER